MTQREFKINGLGGLEYVICLENNLLHIKVKNSNGYGKHSIYKVLKGDVKLINSSLDTIEYISNNTESQKFNIGYIDKNIIFYLIQLNNNLNKNILEFKATLIDRVEF